MQIEQLEDKRDQQIQKIDTRDVLIKELENAINELTQQVTRDQGLLKMASDKKQNRRQLGNLNVVMHDDHSSTDSAEGDSFSNDNGSGSDDQEEQNQDEMEEED